MSKNCGIMRVEKRKREDIYGLQIEANRTLEEHVNGRDFERSDIDWSLTEQNQHLVYTANWNKEISRQLKEAGVKEITKGNNRSVVLLDGIYTSSPEWFDSHTYEEGLDFFKKSLEFHIQHYCGGDESRVINAVIHYDEKTPHMQVASIPIMDTGERLKLCAKDIMGNKKEYHLKQDLFYEEVSKAFGMERGEVLDEGELRLHTTKREWQIATQEERLQEAVEMVKSQEQQIQIYSDTIQNQKREIEDNNQRIETQPHILTKAEIEALSESERPVNKLTGNVSLRLDEYRSLLATKIEAENLSIEKKELSNQKESLTREKLKFKDQKADVIEAAKQEGLMQGSKEQQELIQKGHCFDQIMELVNEDKELSESFQRALTPKAKKYPLLVKAVSEVVEWGKELVEKIRRSIKYNF